MKRAIITIGLGFGDEGKGATIDYLARQYEADLVVRYCRMAGGTASRSSGPAPWPPCRPARAPTSGPT